MSLEPHHPNQRPKSLLPMSPPPKDVAPPNQSMGTYIVVAVILAAIVGGAIVYFKFKFNNAKSHFNSLLRSGPLNTSRYEEVNKKKAHEQLQAAIQKTGIPSNKFKGYVTVLKNDTYNALGSYYLKEKLRGYTRAIPSKQTKPFGCTVTDAMDPNFTMKSLADSVNSGKATGGKAMVNRAKGIVSGNGQQILTGQETDESKVKADKIIFAIDVLAHLKLGPLKRKVWFHRRCFFYKGRREFETTSQIKALLGSN